MTVLPTGNVGPVNLKLLVTLGGTLLILGRVMQHRSWSALSSMLWPSIWAAAFLLIGIVSALAHHVSGPMMATQVKMLAAPLVVCGLGVAFVHLGIISDRGLLTTLVAAHVSYVLAKVGLALALTTGLLGWDHGRTLMSQVWPSPQFSLSGMPGGSIRMVLPNDLVGTVVVAALLSWDRLRLVPRMPYAVVVLATVLVLLGAYQNVTRAIWVMTLAGVAIGCWMAWDRRRMFTLAGIVLAILSLVLAVPGIQAAIIQRFAGTTIAGESIRVAETQALWKAATQSWWWGHGWGHGLADCVRNPELPFDYEIQWMAWLMQCGVLGMSCAMVLVGMMYRQMGRAGRWRFPMIGLFSMWMLAGFTNPLLHCSAAGVYLLMLLLMAGIWGREEAASL